MHGGWSNEYTYLGSPDEPHGMKHILDHGIVNGKIQPMIVVCPTYNNTSSEDSGDYSLALRLTDNYHNELINDLIPAVEGKYSTYAEEPPPKRLPLRVRMISPIRDITLCSTFITDCAGYGGDKK